MYRIEVARGEETVFRTIEELATAIRNGVVTNRARIYHAASQKWLPIEFHPHYKKALELPAGSPSAEPTPSKGPAPRSSGPRSMPTATPPAPAQQHPAPVQHHPSPAQQHPSPVQHHPAPAQHQPAPVKQQSLAIQHNLAPVTIPPPVPSPVLELTRPTFTQPRVAEPEMALALEEPPPPPALEEPAPSATQPSRSWIRRPIQLTVIGAIAIVCTRVVVSAAAPGSEARSLAETAPPPTLGQATAAPVTPVINEKQPGAVLTAGPAFSPAIVTSAEAAKAPPPASAPAKRPAPTAAPADSIQAIDPAPTAVDLALPAVPAGDSLAFTSTTSDSGAIGRILRAVTSTKPAPIKAAAH
jgi:hypothetical protein